MQPFDFDDFDRTVSDEFKNARRFAGKVLAAVLAFWLILFGIIGAVIVALVK